MKEDGAIKSVTDLVAQIKQIPSSKSKHAHVRWLWRGQADCSWKLVPGVYRTSFPAENEDDRLLIERHLAQDFRIESARLLGARRNDAELYFLQQHYGMPTRLLDWSNNALAALFFAVTEVPDKDGTLFFMDGYQLAITQRSIPTYRGIVTSRHEEFQRALKRICNWRENTSFSEFLMAIRPDQVDSRVCRQRSCFTFHVPGHDALTKEKENTTLRFFKIPADRKTTIREELSALGIDDFSIFDDMQSLARRLKNAHNISRFPAREESNVQRHQE